MQIYVSERQFAALQRSLDLLDLKVNDHKARPGRANCFDCEASHNGKCRALTTTMRAASALRVLLVRLR